jgi:hypothetical protein
MSAADEAAFFAEGERDIDYFLYLIHRKIDPLFAPGHAVDLVAGWVGWRLL